MLPLAKRRIHLFSSPFEVMWQFLAVAFLPVAVLAFLLVSRTGGAVQTTPGLVVAVVVIALVNFFPLVSRWRRAVLIALKRRFYLSLLHHYESSESDIVKRRIAQVIRIPFRHARLSHPTQETAVRSMIDHLLRGDVRRCVFFVEGPSGCGKTASLAFLLRAIVSEQRLAALTNKIFYFDFAESVQRQSQFLTCYGNPGLQESIIILDNFHRTESRFLRQLTNYILDCHSGCLERCLVICSQPLELTTGTPHTDIRLINKLKSEGRFFRISDLPVDEARSYLAKARSPHRSASNESAALVRPIPLLQLHYARLINQANRTQHETLLRLLELERADSETVDTLDPINFEIICGLSVIIGLGIHRAVFLEDELATTSLKVAAHYRQEAPGLYRRLMRIYDVLRRSGFLGPTLVNGDTSVFHERLATDYKDRFFKNRLFRETLLVVLAERIQQAHSDKDWLSLWLFSIESHCIAEIHKYFDRAMLTGCFMSMLRHLERNCTSIGCSTECAYELGVLLEKVGDFERARHYLRLAKKASGVDRNKLDLLLIEAEHGDSALPTLKRMVGTNTSALLSVASEYWIHHINSHTGSFATGEMLRLCDRCADLFDKFLQEDSYIAIHVMRRLYFDTIRFMYLEGSRDQNLFASIRDHPLAGLLRDQYPLFEAYQIKFIHAHYVHYNLIWELGAFAHIPYTVDKSIVAQVPDSRLGIEELISIAVKSYRSAEREFEVFGDKTAWYVRARLAELALQSPECRFDKVKSVLRSYEAFIQNTGLRELQGYPQLYWFKYYFLFAASSLAGMADSDYGVRTGLSDFDHAMTSARHALESAMTAETANDNRYGILRIQMLKSLISYCSDGNKAMFFRKIESIRDDGDRYGFLRESRLASSILEGEGLSTSDVVRLVRYYPIVLQ